MRFACVLVLLAARAASSAALPAGGAAGSLGSRSEVHLRGEAEATASTGARDGLSALQRRSAFRNVAHSGRAGAAALAGVHAGHPFFNNDVFSHQKEQTVRHKGLTKKQLANIRSIKCLKEKQQDPTHHCEYNGELEEWHKNSQYTLSIGSFPKNYEDRRCNSHGEFLCDPDDVLEDASAIKVSEKLHNFRDDTAVKCANNVDPTDPYAAEHSTRNFNLAVVIADEWPDQETDASSLQKFGLVVMGQWGLMPMYNGVDTENSVDNHYTWNEYYKNCPNAAALIFLPRLNKVFLSSPSCEFICSSRGGPEVKAVAEEALQREGLAAAIGAGIDEVGRVLRETTPLSLQRNFIDKKKYEKTLRQEQRESQEVAILWSQRVCFLLMLILAIGFIPCFVYICSLERPKEFGRI
mmetsp:Transcript_596/g.991  ORF Transcript_596/g.991 Transcript_596/m.991 type:complete len:409 (+) Transcript_596:99-1325(+)